MKGEFTGRFVNMTHEGKTARLSLASVKTTWGADIARAILYNKAIAIGSYRLELELLPDELNTEDTRKEQAKVGLCRALYADLHESYPSTTYVWLLAEADRLIAGGTPSGGPSMFLNSYLEKAGLKEGG